MSDPQQIINELREYLEKEPNLRREDRFVYLKAIFDKHMEFKKLDHMVTYKDMFNITSDAGSIFTKFVLPLKISCRRLDSGELKNIAVIEAFIGYLQRMNLLKKTVRFEYTDSENL